MRDIIERHLKAFCDGNWDAYKKDWLDRGEYIEMATHRSAKGPDDIVNLVKPWKAAFPDLKANFKDITVAGDKVFVEVEFEGTLTGKFEGPFGTIEPNGKHGAVDCAMLFTLKDRKIVSNHHYFDLMTILAQIGAGARPAVAAAAPPAVH